MTEKIDEVELRRLWGEGVPSSVIASRFGVQYPAVNKAARRLGLPSRAPGGRPKKTEAPPLQQVEKPRSELPPSDLASALLWAKTYSDLEAIRAQHELTTAEVQRLWHKSRAAE